MKISKKDQKWIGLMRGEISPETEEDFQALKAKKAFRLYEKFIGINKIDINKALKKIESNIAQQEKKERKNWFLELLGNQGFLGTKGSGDNNVITSPISVSIGAYVLLSLSLIGYLLLGKMPSQTPDEGMILKGGEIIQQIVANPEKYFTDLQAALNETGSSYKVVNKDNHLFISIEINKANIEILKGRRIEIPADQKIITLEISPSK
jgi:hypothetical protein